LQLVVELQQSSKGVIAVFTKQRWLVLTLSAALPLLPSLVRADEKGDTLLKEVQKATKAYKSLTGVVTTTQTFQGSKMSATLKIQLKRPNLYYAEMSGFMGSQVFASNGKDAYIYMADQKQYMKMKASPNGAQVNSIISMAFFDPSLKMFGDKERAYGGNETIEGKTYEVLEVKPQEGLTVRFYVSPEKLITRMKYMGKAGKDQNFEMQEILSSYKLNALIPEKVFAYVPPKTAKLYEQPSYDAKLLPTNSKAPEFNLATPEGGRVSLANVLKEKKAVLINFWFYG
jgi:outer membrane lipoprotein-sorting protein